MGLPWPHDKFEEDEDHPESANTPRPLVLSSVIESPAKSRSTSIGLDGRTTFGGWMLATQLSRKDSNKILFAVGSAIPDSE